MDPNSVLPLDSLSIKNQDDSDSCFDMLKKLPPLDSLLYNEDPKPNAGFNSQFDPTSFEEFSENIEGNNTISSDTMLTEELFFSSYSSSHVAARNNDSVSSNERCQKRTLKKSNTVTKDKLEMAEIKKFFDRPIKNAAKELNVGLTVLKKRCRELGIHRWPHRKLKSLNSLIGNLKGVGMEEEVKNLEEHRILIKQEPDAELTDGTKKLRQACFKANYKKKKALAKGKITYTIRQPTILLALWRHTPNCIT